MLLAGCDVCTTRVIYIMLFRVDSSVAYAEQLPWRGGEPNHAPGAVDADVGPTSQMLAHTAGDA